MTGSVAQELVSYVMAGARLRRELSPFESDQALLRRGGTVFYAIDTNVVWLFLDPKYLGPQHDGIGGYTHIFPDDGDRVAEALAAALSRYILFRLNYFTVRGRPVDVPLLLLEGHDAEVRSTYDRLVIHAHKRGDRDREEVIKLKEELGWLTSAGNVGEQVERLRASAQEIIELMYLENSDSAQANRLGRLLTAGRLGRLPAAIERVVAVIGDEHRGTIREAFNAPGDLVTQMCESQLRAAWEKRLRAFKNVERRSRTLHVDAGALARLENLNNKLRPIDIRVCLITADNAMINAAAEYRAGDDPMSFSEMYIRHPRAFLAAHEVLTPTATADPGDSDRLGLVINWLDTLLARFTDDHGPSRASLTSIAAGGNERELLQRATNVLATDEVAISALKEQWAAHTSAIRDEHAASSNLAQQEIRGLIGGTAFSDLSASLDRIEQELSATSDETWDAYYRAVVRTGFDLVQAGDGTAGKRRRRNAPAINFETFSNAKDFVREIIAARGFSTFAPGEIDERLNLIEKQGGGYAMLLAYAVLFADAGRWHVALLTAKRAIAVARLYEEGRALSAGDEPVTEEVRQRVSGREAYYFAAVAQRLTARGIPDIENSKAYLVKARAALEIDSKRKDAPKDSGLRFDAEELAASLTHYLFIRFCTNESSSHLAGELKRLRTEAMRLASAATELADNWTGRLVERSALINFFTALAFDDPLPAAEADDPAIGDAARRLIRILASDSESPKQELPVTELIAIVGVYAEAVYGAPDRRRKRRLRDELIAFGADIEGDREGLMMPYDYDRYQHLIRISREALSM